MFVNKTLNIRLNLTFMSFGILNDKLGSITKVFFVSKGCKVLKIRVFVEIRLFF